MKLAVTHDLDNLQRMIDSAPDQLRFATAVALTRTAQDVKKAEEKEMRDVFDRPSPWTMNSLYVRPATKQTLEAEIWIKDFAAKATAPASYLLPQIKGGGRRLKRFERALQANGALPAGFRAVPGDAAKLDANGNMDRGQIVQILSYFKAFPEAGYKANMSDKRRERMARGSKTQLGYSYFVGRPGDRLPLGVWQRVRLAMGTAVRPVLIFVTEASYEAIFDFTYVADLTMRKNFNKHFADAFALAKRSAR